MRIYTHQGQEAYENFQKKGYFSGDLDYITQECDWPKAYYWMKTKMAERIPEFSGDYPIWAWPKRASTKPVSKPRSEDEKYRIIALVPTSRILASDYTTWHCPLNNSPITRTERDFEEFSGDVEKTWDRVFDFTPATNDDERSWMGLGKKLQIQLCVDRIHASEIISLKQNF